LKDVVAGVEARLNILRQTAGEGEGTGSSSSRPATNGSAPSATSGQDTWRGGPWLNMPGAIVDDLCEEEVPCSLFDLPSAREEKGVSGRPTTRDGGTGRPGTRDGGGRPGTRGGIESRSQTRDGAVRVGECDRRQSSLDGVRPGTRDEKRLQQMIDGTTSSRGGTSSRGPQAAVSSSAAPPVLPSGAPPQSRESKRPQTRDGDARPPTRGGTAGGPPSSSRGQDVSIRQVTGRRRKHGDREISSRHGSSGPDRDRERREPQERPEVLSLENFPGPSGSARGTSPGGMWGSSNGFEPLAGPFIDADESVDLLE